MGPIKENLNSDFNFRIVQKVITGQQSQSSIAREYGIAVGVIRGLD